MAYRDNVEARRAWLRSELSDLDARRAALASELARMDQIRTAKRKPLARILIGASIVASLIAVAWCSAQHRESAAMPATETPTAPSPPLPTPEPSPPPPTRVDFPHDNLGIGGDDRVSLTQTFVAAKDGAVDQLKVYVGRTTLPHRPFSDNRLTFSLEELPDGGAAPRLLGTAELRPLGNPWASYYANFSAPVPLVKGRRYQLRAESHEDGQYRHFLSAEPRHTPGREHLIVMRNGKEQDMTPFHRELELAFELRMSAD
jgi:hypothetical protein